MDTNSNTLTYELALNQHMIRERMIREHLTVADLANILECSPEDAWETYYDRRDNRTFEYAKEAGMTFEAAFHALEIAAWEKAEAER